MNDRISIKNLLPGMIPAPGHTLSTVEGEERAIQWMGGLFDVIGALAEMPHNPLAPGLTQSRIKTLAEIGGYLAQDTGDVLESLADEVAGDRPVGG